MILCFFHLIISLKVAPVFLASISSLVILGLYFLVRFGRVLYIPKVILTLFGLLMLDFTWYSKYLSQGPVLFFILIFGALILWVWEGRSLAILLIIYFLNVGVLFYIDYNAAESLSMYPNMKIRTIDIFLSFMFYSSLLIFLLYVVKKEFIRQKDKAIRSDKLKSAFLANMSHEIRTPINAICGFTELLENESDQNERKNYLDIIQKSSDSLLKLINEIINLSKIEAGFFRFKLSDFSVKEMFIELKDIYSIELSERNKANIVLEFDIQDGDYLIHSDLFRLKQIISNLLSNAIKFTSEGKISFSCQKRNGTLLFKVTDTGTGIPKEDQATIFDRFTKYNYQMLNIEGSGIGLSIVEKIVELFNGRVWLKSELGKGSSFYFTVPYVKSKGQTEAIEQQKIAEEYDADSVKNILVVEDDDASLLLITKILNSLKINIHHVTNGKDAIEFIESNPGTDLILMDIKLPGIDGYEATSEIKKINSDIPVIAQTAYAIAGDREKAISIGCDDYISKPIRPDKLLELVLSYVSNRIEIRVY